MHTKEFEDKLYETLMPAFRARYKIVRRTDPFFFKSEVGEAELLSMALISHRLRKHHKQNPITKEELDEAWSHEITPKAFYDEGAYLISQAHIAEYPVDYDKMTAQLMNLFDNLAKDVGLDPLYNRFDMKPTDTPPIDANACILDWERMKNSALMKAPIPAYQIGLRQRETQKIRQDSLIDFYCNLGFPYIDGNIESVK